MEIALMRIPKLAAVAGILLLSLPAVAADKYAVKVVADTPAPKEVQEPIRKLLDNRCVRFQDAKGTVLAELWFRKGIPAKATEAQIKNGLTYAEVPLSTVIGALRVPKQLFDYRKQKLAAGVYTLRLAVQPMDGDHMGTAPYSEFCLVCPAADDKKPDLMTIKALQELSAKVTESHPGVLLLFPPAKDAKEPKVISKPGGHWLLQLQLETNIGGKKVPLPFALTLIGTSESA
jgi:hypothetical protein